MNFKLIEEFMISRGRELERKAFSFKFKDGSKEEYIEAIREFQNRDGGFGRGIEPDFMVPDSSPIATTIGLKHLENVEDDESAQDMIKRAVQYLEESFDTEEKRWFSVGIAVNDYPHAPWWSVNEETGRNAIDAGWGNPTAEILGYLFKYRKYVKRLPLDDIICDAIDRLNEKEDFKNEHELYCYIRMYNKVSPQLKERMEESISKAAEGTVCKDSEKWGEYSPNPLMFVEEDSERLFVQMEDINNNLDYIIRKFENEGILKPNWSWGQYQEQWEKQKVKWSGVMILEALDMLKKFDRLENH